jgi:hypothetical protein
LIVLVNGSMVHPEALAPFMDEEMRVVGQLKTEGVIKAIHRLTGTLELLRCRQHDRTEDRILSRPGEGQ